MIAGEWQPHSQKSHEGCAVHGNLRLADLEKNERETAVTRKLASKGKMTFGGCVAIYQS